MGCATSATDTKGLGQRGRVGTDERAHTCTDQDGAGEEPAGVERVDAGAVGDGIRAERVNEARVDERVAAVLVRRVAQCEEEVGRHSARLRRGHLRW
jgi:hypothetical protein